MLLLQESGTASMDRRSDRGSNGTSCLPYWMMRQLNEFTWMNGDGLVNVE